MTGTMAEQASRPSSAETQQQETLHEALPFHRASGPDQQPRAHQHLDEPDAERHLGPDEHQREHTSELSPAERTRSPRRSGDGSAQEKQQPWTINLGKGPSKSKTDQDGTPCRYHEPDAIPGPPAPATPLGGADPALTPPWMLTPAGWNKDGRRTG